MTDSDYDILSEFSCGEDELDDFFRHEVKECVDRHYLSAYCVTHTGGEIIALFTLMNDALMITSHTEKSDFISDLRLYTDTNAVDFFKLQSSYPAINIGHLGTSSKYQNMGIGTTIIDLVIETFSNYKQAGCQFVTVDSINKPRTTAFYCRNGFSFQTSKDAYSPTRRMYRILN
ncbi:MAG: GNAT family N-acetyltransferase [Muribaculaceae bacterium]|nr:GNAT family N-acetyltransferase [Muribaculaceae bacterium]